MTHMRIRYSWLVMVLVPIVSSMLVLFLTIRVNERSIQRERTARVAAELAQEASRHALCDIYVLLDDAYKKTPPKPGTIGASLSVAVAAGRKANHC